MSLVTCEALYLEGIHCHISALNRFLHEISLADIYQKMELYI